MLPSLQARRLPVPPLLPSPYPHPTAVQSNRLIQSVFPFTILTGILADLLYCSCVLPSHPSLDATTHTLVCSVLCPRWWTRMEGSSPSMKRPRHRPLWRRKALPGGLGECLWWGGEKRTLLSWGCWDAKLAQTSQCCCSFFHSLSRPPPPPTLRARDRRMAGWSQSFRRWAYVISCPSGWIGCVPDCGGQSQFIVTPPSAGRNYRPAAFLNFRTQSSPVHDRRAFWLWLPRSSGPSGCSLSLPRLITSGFSGWTTSAASSSRWRARRGALANPSETTADPGYGSIVGGASFVSAHCCKSLFVWYHITSHHITSHSSVT